MILHSGKEISMNSLDLLNKIDKKKNPVEHQETMAEQEEEYEREILCAFCKNRISSLDEQIVVNGSHDHIFANPHGLVFEVGCYKIAHGCVNFSGLSKEFTWFPGYAWKIAGCRFCSTHLGWFFLSETHSFWGLILDKLIIDN
ncbi:MAG: cereblon family protein [Thermodesulfobacteriota bacterium]|nr:cereblon family protein [Thermodesulfobacteriota bacterium]